MSKEFRYIRVVTRAGQDALEQALNELDEEYGLEEICAAYSYGSYNNGHVAIVKLQTEGL
jgi:hypothetical protein